MNTKLFAELQGNFAENTAPFMAKAGRFVNGRVGNMGQMGLNQLCAALKGDRYFIAGHYSNAQERLKKRDYTTSIKFWPNDSKCLRFTFPQSFGN